jgi:RNA polymerase sigma-70 factor (ECF subfamily)
MAALSNRDERVRIPSAPEARPAFVGRTMSPSPSGSAQPSPELLRAVAAGEVEAVDAWFRAEHPEVYRLCFGFLAHAADAEDVAQEAMLHLHDRLSTCPAAESYRAWRTTLVLNRCRDRLRRSGARRRAEEGAAEGRPERPLPDPHDAAERAEAEAWLALGLRSLSEREREAFVLRDLEGLATAEVARALAITESSVRTLLTLARRRLRELLGARLAPGGEA